MKELKYKEIGRNGTPERFLGELQKAAGSKYYSHRQIVSALIEGAIEAFHQSRPENIQTAFQSPEAVQFNKKGFGPYHHMYFVEETLHKLSENSNDKQLIIDIALAKASVRDKREILSPALVLSVIYDRELSFIYSLLKSGADANAEVDGAEGSSLIIRAMNLNNSYRSPLIIKALCEHGASFDAAREVFLSEGYNRLHGSTEERVELLELYRQALQEQPAEIERLTKEVERLSSLAAAFKANQPRGTKAPAASKSYLRAAEALRP